MKKFIFLLFLLIAIEGSSPSFVFGAASPSGFISGNIWYSQESLQSGDTVKIYTAVWNGSNTSLSVKIDFYDNDSYINSEMATIPPESIEKISIPWKVTSGDHTIVAKIASSTLSSTNGKKPIILTRNTVTGNTISVSSESSSQAIDDTPSVIKKEIAKASQALEKTMIPKIVEPFSESYQGVDSVRSNLLSDIVKSKNSTQSELKSKETQILPGDKKVSTSQKSSPSKPLDATHTPILYIKLFFLQVLAFIFGNKYIFYGLIIICIWFILKLLYHKIKNR